MESMKDNRRVYSVSQINRYVKNLLNQDGILSGIWMRGEISNYKAHSSGHRYFTLKDEGGAIAAVMFSSYAAGLTFVPREGQQVEVQGTVSLYEKTGQYQFYVNRMEPLGRGALYQAFEELKEKLREQGLFDVSKKKELPLFPRKVGLVTSATGAALQDMIRVSKRRNPGVRLVLCPCLVQGEGAAAEIAAGIRRLDREPEVDVIIVGRGGGSMEDLWAFNEEPVAWAIYEAKTPIISAVGHETDVTIADFAADRRAATPSAAAEMAVPEVRHWLETIQASRDRMGRTADYRLVLLRRRIRSGRDRILVQKPSLRLRDWRQQTDAQRERLLKGRDRYLEERRRRITALKDRIELLNPAAQLGKGYALITDEAGRVVSSVRERRPGEQLQVILQDGKMTVTVCTVGGGNEESHGEDQY